MKNLQINRANGLASLCVILCSLFNPANVFAQDPTQNQVGSGAPTTPSTTSDAPVAPGAADTNTTGTTTPTNMTTPTMTTPITAATPPAGFDTTSLGACSMENAEKYSCCSHHQGIMSAKNTTQMEVPLLGLIGSNKGHVRCKDHKFSQHCWCDGSNADNTGQLYQRKKNNNAH